MEYTVTVTRKGQTTIPAELRRKYKIETGTLLKATAIEEGILLKPTPSTADLAGSGAKFASPDEMKKKLDQLRGEDAQTR